MRCYYCPDVTRSVFIFSNVYESSHDLYIVRSFCVLGFRAVHIDCVTPCSSVGHSNTAGDYEPMPSIRRRIGVRECNSVGDRNAYVIAHPPRCRVFGPGPWAGMYVVEGVFIGYFVRVKLRGISG